MTKHSTTILELARRGAEHRLQELRAEMDTLLKHFPHLRKPFGGGSHAPSGGARRRRGMSAAQRKAVSARMKKYWAERRKA